MSTASVAPQQAGSAAGTGSNTALATLSGNMGDFLKLLMTQLQNQNPTNPMDTNQFTSELVQFSSVEQQIQTNSSLTQLIQLTQAGEVMQSSAMLGRTVSVTADHMPLQNGKGSLTFTARAAEPVAIAIYNESGVKLRDAAVTAVKGSNTWSWDGADNSGRRVADGSYKVAVTGGKADGTTAALPFTVTGTATGVTRQDNAVQLQLGGLSVGFDKVATVGN